MLPIQVGVSSISWLESEQLKIDNLLISHRTLTDIEAEELLKNQPVGTYLLRKADSSDQEAQFHVSFIHSDESIHHTPIVCTKHNWLFRNGNIHRTSSLLTLISEIMHRPVDECKALKCSNNGAGY